MPYIFPRMERTSARVRTVGSRPGGLARMTVWRSGERFLEDVAVEKEKRAQGLGLRRGADGAFDGEVGDERVDLGLAHLHRVALVVKEDVAPDPADVGLFGAQAVVARADRVAHAVEEPGLDRGSGSCGFGHSFARGPGFRSLPVVHHGEHNAKLLPSR